MTLPDDARAVLDFWFGTLDEHGLADAEHKKQWWSKSPELDEEIRQRFGAVHADVAAGRREDWLESARGRLAYIIVLDQLSRNMFRDSAEMYAADDRAVAAVLAGLERGHDQDLAIAERTFFYMPLMHSETLAHQDDCVRLFAELAESCPEAAVETAKNHHGYAVQHRDIVARFGRFPHRNAILGRPTSPEEAKFLEGPGSSF